MKSLLETLSTRTTFLYSMSSDNSGAVTMFIEGKTINHEPPNCGGVAFKFLPGGTAQLTLEGDYPESTSPYEGTGEILHSTLGFEAYRGIDSRDFAYMQKTAERFFSEKSFCGKVIVEYTLVNLVESSPIFFGVLLEKGLGLIADAMRS